MFLKKRHLIIFLSLLILGWILGYFSLPYIPDMHHFWLGALSVIFVLILYFSMRTKVFSKQKPTIITLLLLILIISGGYFLLNEMLEDIQNANRETETLLEKSLKQDVKMIYAQEQIYQKRLIDNKLGQIDLLNQPSSFLIAELNRLVARLKILDVFINDSIQLKLSPGKGHLLESLIMSEVSDTIFNSIIDSVDFSFSDLGDADLEGISLISINLAGSDLSRANLNKATFDGSNLAECVFYETEMDSVSFNDCNMENAFFAWVNMDHARMVGANLSGAQIRSSSAKYSRLDSSDLKWTQLYRTDFNHSSMVQTDLWSAKLIESSLSNRNLLNSRLLEIKIEDSDLSNADILGSAVSEIWLEKLKKAKPIGWESLIEKYKVEIDSSARFKVQNHFIKAVN